MKLEIFVTVARGSVFVAPAPGEAGQWSIGDTAFEENVFEGS